MPKLSSFTFHVRLFKTPEELIGFTLETSGRAMLHFAGVKPFLLALEPAMHHLRDAMQPVVLEYWQINTGPMLMGAHLHRLTLLGASDDESRQALKAMIAVVNESSAKTDTAPKEKEEEEEGVITSEDALEQAIIARFGSTRECHCYACRNVALNKDECSSVRNE